MKVEDFVSFIWKVFLNGNEFFYVRKRILKVNGDKL